MKKKTKNKQKEENNALIIFVKNSELGKVKTRLAKDIGDQEALDAYIRMQLYTRDISGKTEATRYIYYSEFIEDQDLWSSAKFHKMAQFGEDLGERMKHAVGFATTLHDKVIIIGSDCVALKQSHIKEAFKALNQHDVVLGPSDDGGYYLLGLNEFQRDYFQDIQWSTSHVLEQTKKVAARFQHKVFLLDQLSDIDYKKEWRTYKDMLEDRYPDISNQLEKPSKED